MKSLLHVCVSLRIRKGITNDVITYIRKLRIGVESDSTTSITVKEYVFKIRLNAENILYLSCMEFLCN